MRLRAQGSEHRAQGKKLRVQALPAIADRREELKELGEEASAQGAVPVEKLKAQSSVKYKLIKCFST